MSNAVLIIEDEAVLAKKIRKYLELRGYATQAATDGASGIEAFEAFRPDIVLLDFNLPGELDGLAVLAHLRNLDPRVKVVLITGHGNVKLAVEAMKTGAYDYLSKPIVLSELELLIDKAVHEDRIDAQLSYYRNKKSAKVHIERILGDSASVVRLRDRIRQIISAERSQAEGDPPAVLITGETGTGKELVARALHFDGLRRDRPLIQINAATLPRDLLESELFGHERGAFTGARERKLGLVEAAEGGTLFLDEIGELDLSMQAKLLRLVEDRQIRRLGGVRDRRVNIRLITATNRSLETMVQEGTFRADLFYRLCIFNIVTPPLRERADDIPCLADHFLKDLGKRYNKQDLRLSAAARSALSKHNWPGNIRELRNALEQAVLVARNNIIRAEHLVFAKAGEGKPRRGAAETAIGAMLDGPDIPKLEDVEREVITRTLQQVDGNVTRAARMLGITRDRLRYRIEKYLISR